MEKDLYADLLALFKRYRSRLLLASLLVILSNSLLILNPLLFRMAVVAVDPSSQHTDGFLSHSVLPLLGSYSQSIWIWVVILISISLIAVIFKYQMRMQFMGVSRDAESSIRSRLYNRLQHQSQAFYDRHRIGDLMSRLTNDISAYRDVLGPGIMFPINFITIAIPAICALFYISPPLATLSMIPIFLMPFMMLAIRQQSYELSRQVQESLSDLSTMTQEHYSAIRVVKGYVAEPQLLKRFFSLCQYFLKLNMRLISFQGVFYPSLTLLTRVVTVMLVMLSGYIVYRASWELGEADFVSFMWVQSYLFFPVLMLGWILPVFEKGRASYDRLKVLYNEPIEVEGNSNSSYGIDPKADLIIQNLTFTYPGSGTPILKNLSLNIKGGTRVGITGPIGSGKSTLLHLLNHDYDVPRGSIKIGNHDIQEYSLKSLRKGIVLVEQSPFLFSKTIAENIRFGKQEALQGDLEAVAELTDLSETIASFPEEYETLVGERGVTLSGGQKQRLALARAFLVSRSIFLLDDSFAAVDTSTEKRIFDAMKQSFNGKTVLLVTHRVSLLEQMDTVLFVRNGTIVEEGSPAELLQLEGHYAALVELQRLNPQSEAIL